MCEPRAANKANEYRSPTLGIIKPTRIKKLRIEADTADWTPAQLGKLRQFTLFGATPKNELQKIPYKFYYSFECSAPDCPTHEMSCTD
jgi:hypothetical protein